MARLPRLDVPDLPQHIIQRGNNRTACFFHPEDYEFYLLALDTAAQKYACRLHAYVLMTNHVHLLLTGTQSGAVSALMQALGRRYVRYINTTYRRTGTLWEGRFVGVKSCYLLFCVSAKQDRAEVSHDNSGSLCRCQHRQSAPTTHPPVAPTYEKSEKRGRMYFCDTALAHPDQKVAPFFVGCSSDDSVLLSTIKRIRTGYRATTL